MYGKMAKAAGNVRTGTYTLAMPRVANHMDRGLIIIYLKTNTKEMSTLGNLKKGKGMVEEPTPKPMAINTKSIVMASAFHIGMLVLILFTVNFFENAFGIGTGASYFVKESLLYIWLGYIIICLFWARNYLLAIPLFLFLAWTTQQNYSSGQALNEPGNELKLTIQGFGYVAGAVIAFGAIFLKKELTKKFANKTSNTITD
jgi:hypothetical protein